MTAETAVVLPVLVAIVAGLVWLVSLAATEVRVVDAARETARAAARDETRPAAVELGQRVAPAGSRISLRETGTTVVVDVVAQVRGPGSVFRFLPGIDVTSRAVAAKETR